MRRALFRGLWAGGVAAVLAAGSVAWLLTLPLDVEAIRAVRASGQLLDRNGGLLHVSLSAEETWCLPVDGSAVSPYLIQATVAVEDQRFFRHPGVDPVALLRAAAGRLRGVRSGASTLSMQCINLGGHQSRTLLGKLSQMQRALRLERALSKREILAVYLNKAPYGRNVIGAEAAARCYFGKSAAELSLPEAALLAGLPKAPSRLQPLVHPERARARRAHVLRRMCEEGYIGEAERARAEAAPLQVAWHALPRHAPHLAAAVQDRLRREGRVQTTLDGALQARIEALLPRYLRRFDHEITNAAVMVVDAASAEVLARAGSAGFHAVPGGQVDMCAAPRSPGSALKPFTYALAMERGLLYPTEKLLDDTIDFGTYAPENFDGIFNGLVTAQQALQLSLNVPAVATLDRVGIGAMQEFLQRTGITTLTHAPAHYGLGLTLGNCGVRLDELAAAYAMLANMGEYRPLRLFSAVPQEKPRRVLRPDTALALYAMLEHPFPKEPPSHLIRGRNPLPRVCWKTGTSTGFHDAWTVAFNRQYVVAVWVGNSDGRPAARIVGALAALPLAGMIFRGLPVSSAPVWPDSAGLQKAAVICSLSGLPAGASCPHTETVMLPSGQFLNRRCDVHYPGAAGGVISRWPADARRWDLARIRGPLALPSEAGVPPRQQTLRITAPPEGAVYVYTGESGGDSLCLRASVDDDVALYWYCDGQHLGMSQPGAPVFLPLRPGRHTVSCMGPEGQSDTVRFEVEMPGGSA
jgi:penicillin-binding protein 1C